jgi:hypothetical protein
MFSGLTGVAQKKGSAEAASGGRNSVVDAFVPLLFISQIFKIVNT